jgi:hypothetical protein
MGDTGGFTARLVKFTGQACPLPAMGSTTVQRSRNNSGHLIGFDLLQGDG